MSAILYYGLTGHGGLSALLAQAAAGGTAGLGAIWAAGAALGLWYDPKYRTAAAISRILKREWDAVSYYINKAPAQLTIKGYSKQNDDKYKYTVTGIVASWYLWLSAEEESGNKHPNAVVPNSAWVPEENPYGGHIRDALILYRDTHKRGEIVHPDRRAAVVDNLIRTFMSIGKPSLFATGPKAHNSNMPGKRRFSKKRNFKKSFKKGRRKRHYKKRTHKKVGARVNRRISKVSRKATRALKLVNDMHTKHTYRYVAYGNITAADNARTIDSWNAAWSVAEIEAMLSAMNVYDEDTNTWVTKDFTTAAIKNFKFRVQGTTGMNFRNNYLVPVHLTVMLVTPKIDTSTDVDTCISDGWTDVTYTTSGVAYDQSRYLSDNKLFKAHWNVVKVKKALVAPGQELGMVHKTPWFNYNPAITDHASQTYQKRNFAHCYLFKIQGPIAHSNDGAAKYGTAACGLDYQLRRSSQVIYNGGMPNTFITITDGASAPTTAHRVGVTHDAGHTAAP